MVQWVWSEGNSGCVLEGISVCGPVGILEISGCVLEMRIHNTSHRHGLEGISGCVLEMIVGRGPAGINRCGMDRISGSGPGCVF